MPNFVSELRRRNVFRVGGAYAVVGWILAQVAVTLETALALPSWIDTVVVSTLLVGFPVALGLAWTFEVTTQGIKRTKPADGSSPKDMRALDYAVIGGLIVVVGLVGWQFAAHRDTGTTVNQPILAQADIQDQSIAVLPFADLSPDGDQGYFSDGIAEEILNVLARVDGLKVASRTSAFRYKARSDKSVPEIAVELGVAYVLEGSVRKAGDAVRVTAQLIRAGTDEQLWSETFDRTLTVENLFAIQDEIASGIVEELGIQMELGRTNAIKFAAAAGTKDLRAYDAFLEGRDMFVRRARVDIPRMIAKLEEAVEIDPNFARGWSALAATYAVQESWGRNDLDYNMLALEAANRALSLQPDLAMPHGVIGMTSRLPDGRPDKIAAIENLTRAVRLDPNEPVLWSWRGQHLTELGFFEDAERDFARALELDPADIIAAAWRIDAWFFSGEIDKAISAAPPGYRDTVRVRATQMIALIAQGEADRAIEEFKNTVGPENIKAQFVAVLTEENLDYAQEYAALRTALVEANLPLQASEAPSLLYAFKQYEKMGPYPDLSGSKPWWFGRAHEDFLTSPERHRLFRQQGLEDYWREKGFPPQCRIVDPLPDGRDFECD